MTGQLTIEDCQELNKQLQAYGGLVAMAETWFKPKTNTKIPSTSQFEQRRARITNAADLWLAKLVARTPVAVLQGFKVTETLSGVVKSNQN